MLIHGHVMTTVISLQNLVAGSVLKQKTFALDHRVYIN